MRRYLLDILVNLPRGLFQRGKFNTKRYQLENPYPEPEKVKSIRSWICPCPCNNCKGFVDSDDAKCCMCSVDVCTKCRKVKKRGHMCLKEDVESVKEIEKSTVPCPECKARIYRIDGCRQVFCTICHTRFDWYTGNKISSKWFHNPHLIEWERSGGSHRNMYNQHACEDVLPTYGQSSFIWINLGSERLL